MVNYYESIERRSIYEKNIGIIYAIYCFMYWQRYTCRWILRGMLDGDFHSTQDVTLAQVATVIVRLLRI